MRHFAMIYSTPFVLLGFVHKFFFPALFCSIRAPSHSYMSHSDVNQPFSPALCLSLAHSLTRSLSILMILQVNFSSFQSHGFDACLRNILHCLAIVVARLSAHHQIDLVYFVCLFLRFSHENNILYWLGLNFETFKVATEHVSCQNNGQPFYASNEADSNSNSNTNNQIFEIVRISIHCMLIIVFNR